jgi:membrane protease YdiL (CAAX protease family)
MPSQAKQLQAKTAWIQCILFLGIWFISLILFSIPGLIFFDVFSSTGTQDFALLKNEPDYLLVNQLSAVLAVSFAVYIMRKMLEKETVAFPWLRIDFKGFLQGSLLALGLISISAAILAVSGLVEFSFQAFSSDLLTYLTLFLMVALHEEILTRGYLLDTLYKAYGKWVGIGVSTLIFAGLHIFNDHVGWIGMSNIFLSGVLMALFFLRKKNLWAPIGIHFAWNYAQGPIYGFAVSGIEVRSLLEVDHLGSSILTGSEFGLEGSLIALTILTATIFVVTVALNRKKERSIMEEKGRGDAGMDTLVVH